MKTTRDFHLSFRPKAYWEHGDPTAAILSGVKGEARRLLVREALEAGQDVSEGLLEPLLEEEARRLLGAIHPLLMGGEYVPPDLPGETTIVRIDLRSTTFDVTELRARPGGAGLLDRFVDEYENWDLRRACWFFDTTQLCSSCPSEQASYQSHLAAGQ